jgi:predicted XRE-type DNA-binding protein
MKTNAQVSIGDKHNILAGAGPCNGDEQMLKTHVVAFIGRRIEQLRLNQQAAAKRMSITQPDVSNIIRGRFGGFSLSRLLGFVRALGNDVEITVKRSDDDEKNTKREGRMSLTMV